MIPTVLSRLLASPALFALLVLGLAACSGGGADEGEGGAGQPDGGGVAASDAPAGEGGGDNGVAKAAPGTAVVVVDGQTLEFPTLGATCNFDEDGLGFNFLGDAETTVSAGLLYDNQGGGMFGSFVVYLPGADGYVANVTSGGAAPQVDGQSVTYAGPWEYQPANDGSLPTPRPVGEGTIAATCP
jgi:hypothetical protein